MRTSTLILFLFFCSSSFAFNLDCDGKIFRSLESDKETVVTEPFGLGNKTTKTQWTAEVLQIMEDMLDSMGMGVSWVINRKDLSYEKTTISLGEPKKVESGQCKLWEKPADSLI